ncbi:hypothetical protein N7470_000158 [Penicillium chermesinum]|nr:hypothetical protein N7470_000158 [Penicillium chermesinum]
MDESYSDYSDETESTVLSKWEDIPDDENGVATVTGASYRINDDPGSPAATPTYATTSAFYPSQPT